MFSWIFEYEYDVEYGLLQSKACYVKNYEAWIWTSTHKFSEK